MNIHLKLTALALSVAALSACSVTHEKHLIEQASSDANGTARYRATLLTESATLDAKRAAQNVNRPFITGRAVPVGRDVTLPLPLRKGVDTTLLFSDGAVDLATLAGRIQDATGIPVQVKPDALLPAEDFMPNFAESSQQSQATSYPATADPAAGLGLDSGMAADLFPTDMQGSTPTFRSSAKRTVNTKTDQGNRPLDATLDTIALKLFVSWKYDSELGAIVFYRTETRVFEVRNLEQAGSAEMTVGLSGSTDGASGSNGLESRSKSVIKADRQGKPMDALVQRTRQFMTKAGRAVAGEDGFLVVTDTKASLDRIEHFIKSENAMRSRRIDLVFEQITIERTNSLQGGVNWNLAFRNGSDNGITVNGLNSLIEQEGAAMSVGLSAGAGNFAGSSVAVQALSKVGRVVSQRMDAFGTTNGQPATIGRPQRMQYIDKLEQTQSYSDSSSPTVSVTQKEIVFGRLITFLPYAYSDGDISLAFKYDDTPEPVITKQSQPNGSFVQQPHVVSDVFVRKATLRPGQPYVIAAQTEDSQTSNERRTDPKMPMVFGGSDATGSNQRVTVSVITAMVREK